MHYHKINRLQDKNSHLEWENDSPQCVQEKPSLWAVVCAMCEVQRISQQHSDCGIEDARLIASKHIIVIACEEDVG